MAIRYLKIALVTFVGLQGLLYVVGNIANWDAAVGAIGYVLGMEANEIYSNRIFPAITNPILVTAAFITILTGEFLVGALSLKGAWDLWYRRKDTAEVFNSAKTYAILGAGMALVVWFGLFIVIGGALFQMWQSEIGAGSFEGAFIYAGISGLVLLFVNIPDR
ncbi:MAG: DUF2165 domain-containing protein [Gammaproteobacteria bacterium]